MARSANGDVSVYNLEMRILLKSGLLPLVAIASLNTSADTFTCKMVRDSFSAATMPFSAEVMRRADSYFATNFRVTNCSSTFSVGSSLAETKTIANNIQVQQARALSITQKCCAGDDVTCGQILSSDPLFRASQNSANSQAAQRSASAQAGTDQNSRDSLNSSATANKYSLEVLESVVGACVVRAKHCQVQLKAVKDKLAGCTDADCVSTLNKVKSIEGQCNALSPAAAIAKANGVQSAITAAQNGSSQLQEQAVNPNDPAEPAKEDSGFHLDPSAVSALMTGLQTGLNMQNPEQDSAFQQQGMDCASNPNIAGCIKENPGTFNTGFQPSNMTGSGSQGGFNPSDVRADPPGEDPAAPASTNPTASSNPGIPNNSGGSIPQSQAAAGGGAPPTNGAASNASSGKADILHGVGSTGGYSQTNAGMNMAPSSSGGFGGYGQAVEPQGVELSQFLPGGAKDPTRMPAGLAVNIRGQVNGAQVDIWNRISDRVRARCSQGLLRDCIP